MMTINAAAVQGCPPDSCSGLPVKLSVQGVTKAFQRNTILRGIDLDVARGTITAIVGASGCGKTTLLRVLAGFEHADAGHVVLDGKNLGVGRNSLPAHKRGIGYVAQDGALFPHLSVGENVGFGIRRVNSRERKRRVATLLEQVCLDPELARRRPDQLSGGQQQRVAVARALACRPSLVLLDEPFSALDAGLRAEIRESVRKVLGDAGVTTVLVTHDQEEALSFAENVAVLKDGVFAQVGPPQQVYLEPTCREVAQFVGDITDLPDGRVVRPEQLQVTVVGTARNAVGNAEFANTDAAIVSDQVSIPESPDIDYFGVVGSVAFHGQSVRVSVTLSDGTSVTAVQAAQEAPQVWDRVRLHVTGLPLPL